MVIQFLNKILALILAFIVIFSSLSFTVEKHICMDEVTDVSFFTEADSCGMQEDECKPGETGETNSFDEQDCCSDVHELIRGNQQEQQAINGFEITQMPFLNTYAYTYLNLFEENREEISFFDNPSPPLIDRDLQVLYQTFLI